MSIDAKCSIESKYLTQITTGLLHDGHQTRATMFSIADLAQKLSLLPFQGVADEFELYCSTNWKNYVYLCLASCLASLIYAQNLTCGRSYCVPNWVQTNEQTIDIACLSTNLAMKPKFLAETENLKASANTSNATAVSQVILEKFGGHG